MIEASLPDVSSHVLRNTAMVHMATAGVTLDEIGQYLGCSHARVAAFTYAHRSQVHLRKAANAPEFEWYSGSLNLGLLSYKQQRRPWAPCFIGRSERIRTSDPCLPKTVLYQAELHSDRGAWGIPL